MLLMVLSPRAIAQRGYAVAKDYRIAKFEKDIILYLIQEKQVMDIKTPFNIEDYKFQVMAWKCLEVYADTSSKNLLLIGFSTSADHGDKFWGILADGEKYFFYNTNDPGFLTFKKSHDLDKVAIIKFYCDQSALKSQNLKIPQSKQPRLPK